MDLPAKNWAKNWRELASAGDEAIPTVTHGQREKAIADLVPGMSTENVRQSIRAARVSE
jgi:hypothetical protein